QAKKAWEHGKKSQQHYNALTGEQKSAMWQYGRDQGLIDPNNLDEYKKSELNKYATSELKYAPKPAGFKTESKAVKDDYSPTGYSFEPVQVATGSKEYDRHAFGNVYTPAPKQSIKPIPKMTPAQKKVYAEELGLNPKEPLVIPKTPSKQLVVGKGVKKNVVPQGKIISSGLNKVNNPIISGLGKGVMATLDAVGSAFQAPATIAVRGGEGYQSAVDNGKNGLLGTIKGIGTGINDVLKRENTVQNTQLIEAVAPKTTAELKTKYPGAYNVISTLADFIGVDDMFAIGLAGDITKVMKLNNMPSSTADLNRLFSKIQSNAPLTAVEKAIVKENPDLISVIRKDLGIDAVGGKVKVTNEVAKPSLIDNIRKDMNIPTDINARLKDTPQITPKPLSNINTQPIVNNALKPIVATPKVAQISFDEFKSMVTKKGSVSGRGEYALYLNGKQLTQFDSPSYEKAYQSYLKQQSSMNEAIARRSVTKAPLKPNLAAQEIAATAMKEPKNEKLLSFAQTMKNSDNTATELKQLIKDNPLSYEPINNPDTLKYAKEIVDENFDAAKALVKQGDSFANATEATMAQDVIRRMQQEASTNPAKWDEVFEVMEVTAKKYKKAGQTVQTAAMWSRMTPDGMLNYAQRAVNQANDILPMNKKIKLDPKLAQRITETMTQIQEAPEQVLDLIKKQTGGLPKWADDMLLSKSNDQLKDVAIAQVLSDIGNQVPSNIWKKISTAQALSHLLNVKTISRNILGNTGFGVVENISNVLAVPVDKMLAKATGKRSLALPQLKGSFKAGIDRAKESALDIKLGINRSGVAEGKYNVTTGQSFKGGIGAAGEKALKYSLVVPDEFAKGQIYDNVLKQQMKAGKVTTPTKEMVEYANQRALYGTFQDESLPATIMQGAKDLLNKLGGGNKVRGGSGLMTREFGAGDLMIKYTKVPGNIISRTVEYTPMGLLKLLSIGKNAKIANKQAEMAMTIGRAATGTMMIGLGAALKNAGLLVGEDKDRSTKALTLDRTEGLGNYSVNLSAINRIIAGGSATPEKGDELYSYGWLEPVSKSFAIGAAVATEMAKESTVSEKGYKVAANTVDELLDISTLFVIRKMTYQDNVFDVMLTPVTESVSGFVPSPVRQLASTLDPAARETKASTPAGTALNKVKANIPGLRQTLEPRISPFGQEVKYPGGVVQNMINPGQKSIYNPSEITDKLKRLEDLTGLSIQYPSTSAPSSVTSKKQPFALTPKDKTNYQKLAGQETEKVYKQILANKDIENMSEAQLETLVKQLQSANLKSRGIAKLDFLRK
ncbi:MAG TPA: hypothetical protein VMV86_06015, partial [Methanosarcinales archaeon]|nr:hypothetical protein [Methanosarcinales archaeon]